MCGIAGYFDVNAQIDSSGLAAMVVALKHRGPDAHGFYSYKGFHLCHTRLSIIDLRPESNQPFVSNCGNYVIVFNGEIYNYQELREQYNLKCRTLSDTEVILELFIQLGKDHVNLLNGMFAYTILDLRAETLYLFRDRIGVKPLFWFHQSGVFAFASELKALKQIPFVKSRLSVNETAVSEFLHLGYIPEPHSIYREIHKFPSGSMGIFKESLQIERYWSIEDKIKAEVISNEQEASDELEKLLHSSVKYRLIADVPVGVFLSGGVDSSLVTALASQHHQGKIKSFTIGFKDGKFDESKHAKRVAEHISTDHQEWIITEKEVFQNIDNIFDIYDEPYADQSMLPSLAVCHLASKEVKVVLTGDGGDEFFYGYGAYTWARRLQNPLIKHNRKLFSKTLALLNPRYKRVAELLDFESDETMISHLHAKENGYFSNKELHGLLLNHQKYTAPVLSSSVARQLSALERQAIFDAEVYLKDDLLVKMDRASMHHSLEAREPLLDYRIAEFALNLDPKLKKNGNTDKYLLKKVLYKYIPKELMDRPKWGFTIPLDTWLNKDLAYLKQDYLNEKTIRDCGLVDYKAVTNVLEAYPSKPYKIQQIWALILLHKWLKEEL